MEGLTPSIYSDYNTDMIICRKCIVTGQVQGVWYRGSTQQQAELLYLTGKATNLSDGSVEVIACGEPAKLDQLNDWLWEGPTYAEVTNVQCENLDITPPHSFITR